MITSDYELEQDARILKIKLNGVYSKDKLPHQVHQGSYIINLSDDKTSSGQFNDGTHWCCCFVEDSNSVYMDPFGLDIPANVQLFLREYQPIFFVSKQIQNIRSGWCGMYCLHFLYFMTRHSHIDFKERILLFERLYGNPEQNLSKLKFYLRHFFQHRRKKIHNEETYYASETGRS